MDRPVRATPLILSDLPQNPTTLGSGEAGSTGFLADFTFAANIYYEIFVIAPGDPFVMNINIPVRFCATPILEATKTVVRDPVVQPDGRSAVSYEVTLSNAGATRAENVNMTDDLVAVFGAGRFEVVEL